MKKKDTKDSLLQKRLEEDIRETSSKKIFELSIRNSTFSRVIEHGQTMGKGFLLGFE